jgi:hypothetical protein
MFYGSKWYWRTTLNSIICQMMNFGWHCFWNPMSHDLHQINGLQLFVWVLCMEVMQVTGSTSKRGQSRLVHHLLLGIILQLCFIVSWPFCVLLFNSFSNLFVIETQFLMSSQQVVGILSTFFPASLSHGI